MRQSLILPLQLPHTDTTDCGGWPQELPSRCQGLQILGAESYRQWRGRKAPNARKWRHIEVTPWPQRGVASWRKRFNTNSLYQLRWTAFGEQPFLLSQLCPPILRAIVSRRKCLQTSRRSGFYRRAVAKGSEISKMGRIDFRHQG